MPIAAATQSCTLVYGRLPHQRGVLGNIIACCAGGRQVYGELSETLLTSQ